MGAYSVGAGALIRIWPLLTKTHSTLGAFWNEVDKWNHYGNLLYGWLKRILCSDWLPERDSPLWSREQKKLLEAGLRS